MNRRKIMIIMLQMQQIVAGSDWLFKPALAN